MRQSPEIVAALKGKYGTRWPRFRLSRREIYGDKSFAKGTVVQCDVTVAECNPDHTTAFLAAFPDLTFRWVYSDAVEVVRGKVAGR